jgi:hypothetical protein
MPGNSIGDFTALTERDFLVLERTTSRVPRPSSRRSLLNLDDGGQRAELVSGILRRTWVPVPGELARWNSPPTLSTRSRIPNRP